MNSTDKDILQIIIDQDGLCSTYNNKPDIVGFSCDACPLGPEVCSDFGRPHLIKSRAEEVLLKYKIKYFCDEENI
jgi:hypothetical protein